ncbi:MAG: response regulator [Candidatus Pacebacteria bacterium]|nr:response regulator [Candidatus Paceibacterota bacterium]
MNNILIIEDEDFLIRALKDNLLAEGCFVDVAKNGEEAIERMKGKEPDLILLDILMPKSDGFHVLKEIKSHTKWKSVPVIILSNLGEEMVIKQALRAGANDYFIKSQHPIHEVIKKVKEYLYGK